MMTGFESVVIVMCWMAKMEQCALQSLWESGSRGFSHSFNTHYLNSLQRDESEPRFKVIKCTTVTTVTNDEIVQPSLSEFDANFSKCQLLSYEMILGFYVQETPN